jgi:hypothetical protein
MPHGSSGSSSSRRHRHRHRSLRRKAGEAAADFWLRLSAGAKRGHRRKRSARRMAVDAWMWVWTLPKRHPGLGTVITADVLITYLYSLTVYALMLPPPPAPSAMHVLTQPSTYVYIAPVAMLAALLGGNQVVHAWARRPRWWRLSPQAAAIGGMAAFLITFPDAVLPVLAPVARAVGVTAVLAAGLGAVLTCANYLLARALRPRTRGRRRSRSSTVSETPPLTPAAD